MSVSDALAEWMGAMVDLPRHGNDASDYPHVLMKVSLSASG
jgi:hypothetical protein